MNNQRTVSIPNTRAKRTENEPPAGTAFGGFAEFWNRNNPRAAVVFWVVLLSMSVLRAYVGLSGTRMFSHDAFVMLDGAWRMMHGQRPHVDFSSIVGPAAYLPTLIGLRLSGGQASGFGYGQAIAGMLLGIWAYGMGSQLSPALRTAFALCAAAIALYPAQIGLSVFEITPATTYNKYGYSLLAILVLECVQLRRGSDFKRGISTGAIVVVLAFLKSTYFILAIAMLATLYRVGARTKHQWVGRLTGAGIVGACFLSYLHFHLGAVFHDLQQTIAARQIAFFDLYQVNSIALEAALALIIGLGGAAWLRSAKQQDAARRVSLVSVTMVVASAALLFSSWQPAGLPMVVFSSIFVIDELIRARAIEGASDGPFHGVIVAASTAFVGVTLVAALVSLLWGSLLMVWIAPRCLHFNSPVLASFVPIGEEQKYTAFVNDGLRLLEDNRRPDEHVMSLDFSNPFSFGLGIPPAVRGSSAIQFGSSFNDEHKWSAEQLFGAAELVMVPKHYSDGSLELSVPRNYGPYLAAHYRAAAESADWVLYRRLP